MLHLDAYEEDQLKLKWTDRLAIDKNKDIKLPDMYLRDIGTGTCNGTYSTGTQFAANTVLYYSNTATGRLFYASACSGALYSSFYISLFILFPLQRRDQNRILRGVIRGNTLTEQPP